MKNIGGFGGRGWLIGVGPPGLLMGGLTQILSNSLLQKWIWGQGGH